MVDDSNDDDEAYYDSCSFDRFHNQARARGKDYIPVIGAGNGEWTSPDYCDRSRLAEFLR